MGCGRYTFWSPRRASNRRNTTWAQRKKSPDVCGSLDFVDREKRTSSTRRAPLAEASGAAEPGLFARRSDDQDRQTVKELPQPQVLLTLGLLNLKPAPSSDSM